MLSTLLGKVSKHKAGWAHAAAAAAAGYRVGHRRCPCWETGWAETQNLKTKSSSKAKVSVQWKKEGKHYTEKWQGREPSKGEGVGGSGLGRHKTSTKVGQEHRHKAWQEKETTGQGMEGFQNKVCLHCLSCLIRETCPSSINWVGKAAHSRPQGAQQGKPVCST